MKKPMVILIILSFVISLINSQEKNHSCPSPERISPCRCIHNKGWNTVEVECAIVGQDQLVKANAILQNHSIDSYYIHNADLREIVSFTFSNITARKLRIFDTFVETFFLFGGVHSMQHVLEEITISNVDVQYWITTPGYTFVNLRIFKFNDCPRNPRNETRIIPYLPKTLTEVNFHRCRIKSTEEFTFKEFTKLQQLTLSSNLLTSVKRSYLPKPALHLSFYSLSNNPIRVLPDDMFVDMPALRIVWLQSTLLTILPYYVFKPILKKLNSVQIWDIPLNCSCDTAWLLRERSIWQLSGANCDYPHRLRNRELDSLTDEEMCPREEASSTQKSFVTVLQARPYEDQHQVAFNNANIISVQIDQETIYK